MPLVLDPIQSGYNLSKINENFEKIQDTWDEKLDRVNSGSFYNQMDQTLDMNSNEIINVKTGDSGNSLVTKGYVDAQDDLRVLKAGDSMTGQLNTIDPVQPSNATNKRYVDGMIATIDGVEGIVPLVSPRQQGDGVTTVFPTIVTSQHPTQSYSVNLDGVTQRPRTDYTADTNGNVVFAEAPELGVDIDITVFEPVNLQEAADLSQVTSTGSTTPRTLADRFADTVNVKDFGAVGDGVADDTQPFKDALVAGKNVFIPTGTYLITDTLLPEANQLIYGTGASSELIFNYVDISRDFIRIVQPNVIVRDLKVSCNALGDTENSGAICLRNGSNNCLVENTLVEDVPATAYIMEQTTDSRLQNVTTRSARRHGIYIIASDNPLVDGFKVYNNKLEPVVLRGISDTVATRGYRVQNGLIDGVHPETVRWNAITLAQHPNQPTQNYVYQDIIIQNVVVQNPFDGSGYGAFFYYNGEPFRYCSFLNNTHYGNGQSIAFDFRDGDYLEIKNNRSFSAYNSSFSLVGCSQVSLKNNAAYNPARSGSSGAAGVLISGASSDITIDNQRVHQFSGSAVYGIRSLDTSDNIRVTKADIVGLTTEVEFANLNNSFYGDRLFATSYTVDNLAAGVSGAIATGQGGSGTFVIPSKGFVRGLTVNTNDLPTTGNASFQLRVNGAVIATAQISNTSGDSVSTFVQPTSHTVNVGDEMQIIVYSSGDWDKPNADFSITAVTVND